MGRWANLTIVALLLSPPATAAAAENDIGNIPPGRFSFELRPRYNYIDESNKPLDTEGGTLRALAGWRSAPYEGLQVAIEGIYTDRIGPKRFNDNGADNSTSPYPLLPDPRYHLSLIHI